MRQKKSIFSLFLSPDCTAVAFLAEGVDRNIACYELIEMITRRPPRGGCG